MNLIRSGWHEKENLHFRRINQFKRKQFYESIGEVVNKLGYQAYIPHIHTDPELNPEADSKDVYDIDMEQVQTSCMVIAYVGYPSLGVGAELERANASKVPLILLYQEGEKVSRLALGVPMVKEVICFWEEEDGLKRVRSCHQTNGSLKFPCSEKQQKDVESQVNSTSFCCVMIFSKIVKRAYF